MFDFEKGAASTAPQLQPAEKPKRRDLHGHAAFVFSASRQEV
jgi:hypothetical protein